MTLAVECDLKQQINLNPNQHRHVHHKMDNFTTLHQKDIQNVHLERDDYTSQREIVHNVHSKRDDFTINILKNSENVH